MGTVLSAEVIWTPSYETSSAPSRPQSRSAPTNAHDSERNTSNMSRQVHGGRALINLPGHHSTAAIIAEVDDTTGKTVDPDDDGYQLVGEAICQITDCDNKVRIELDITTANQLENSLFKVDTIIETLLSMRDGLVIEHHRLQDRLDKYPDPTRLYSLRNAVGKRSDITVPPATTHRWEGSE